MSLPALKWNNAAGQNLALTVHLNHEYPSAIRRKIGVMRHAAFSSGHVDVTAVPPVSSVVTSTRCSPSLISEKSSRFPCFDPGQRRRVGQQKMRVATESGNPHVSQGSMML